LLQNARVIDDLDVGEEEVLLFEVRTLDSKHAQHKSPFSLTQVSSATIKKTALKGILYQAINRSPSNVEAEILKRIALDIKSMAPKKANLGMCGLQNLGNTCFMNSILQCISNTEPIAKYFLFEVYLFHLNQSSIFGSKGKLAVAFADFIAEMYLGEANYLAPWDIKRVISQKAVQFTGFKQHDSQEFLGIFLETLHEDVNSVTKKPYVQHKDTDQGRTDESISKEYWNFFKKREQSIFIDLFYGQLKSKVQCTRCGFVSLSFDAFNMLSLPIPTQTKMNITLKYIPRSLSS